MPVIQLVDEIEFKVKDMEELGKEITFDSFKAINSDDVLFGKKLKCLCLKIENLGQGIVTGITMSKIIVFAANDKLVENDMEEGGNEEGLFQNNNPAEKSFTLNTNEIKKINIVIDGEPVDRDYNDDEYMDGENSLSEDGETKKAIEQGEIVVYLDLTIGSLGNSCKEYIQPVLKGVYDKGVIIYSSSGEIIKLKG